MSTEQRWLGAFNDFLQYLQIDSKETGATSLANNLYGAQVRFMTETCEALDEGIHQIVCLKARQLGITTVSLAVDLFWLLVHPGIQGALVTDTDGNKNRFRITIDRYFKSLPKELLGDIKIVNHNSTSLVLSNGSVLDYLVAGVKKGGAGLGRSRALNFLHATEVSSYGDPEGVASLMATLAEHNPNRLYIFESPLALDTPIPTPGGWRTMGEMKEGHIVFDEKGKPCRVKGVSPVFINRKCYKIHFENGDSIVADEDHKWQVEERRYPNNPQWKTKIIPTKELNPEKHRIQVTKPLELPDSPLPVDPYFLGAWLGDGLTGQTAMVAGDEDMEEMRGHLAANGCRLSPVSKNNWRVGKFTILGERATFIKLGLIGNKHIPEAYLRASEKQRRELLAGLMDTDGSIDKKTFHCDFTSTSPALLDSVGELLSSLGIKFHRSKHAMSNKVRTFPNGRSYMCSPSERLNFSERPECIVFKLKRKKNIQNSVRGYTWRKGKFLRIVSVEETQSVPVKCISVDTPSHLFLAGKTMIPTHNTAKGFNLFWEMWEAAKKDVHTQRAVFIGWWAKESYRIGKDDPRFKEYWDGTIEGAEERMLKKVKADYGHDITPEQLAWYRWCKDTKITGEGMMEQEYPSYAEEAFISTGRSFFPTHRIAANMQAIADARIVMKGYRYHMGKEFLATELVPVSNHYEADLKVWQEPAQGGDYVMGFDPAYGRGGDADNHAIVVLRCYADCVVQVAEYVTNDPTTYQAAWVMAHLAGYYRKVRINLEIQGPGGAVMQEMNHLRQLLDKGAMTLPANTDVRDIRNIFASVGWYLYHRPDSPGNGYVYNISTNFNTKSVIMNQMRDCYVLDQLKVSSVSLLKEMQRVIQDGDSIEADGTAHDDRVLATAFAVKCWIDNRRADLIARNRTLAKVMLEEDKLKNAPHATLVGNIVGSFYKEQADLRHQNYLKSRWNVRGKR